MVGISLLSAIGYFQAIPYDMNFHQSLINQFGTQKWSLTQFKQSNWRSTFPTIQGFKRSHRYRWMINIVVKELDQRKMFIPISLEVDYPRSKQILNGLNTRRFTINLGIKSRSSLHLVPNPFYNDLQNLDVNCAPLSDIMENWIPWRYKISYMKILA